MRAAARIQTTPTGGGGGGGGSLKDLSWHEGLDGV